LSKQQHSVDIELRLKTVEVRYLQGASLNRCLNMLGKIG